MTSIIQKSHFVFRNEDRRGKKPRLGQMAPHTYKEDILRMALKWTFLGRGSIPPGTR
jgi:hypothetical protein